MQTHIRAGGTTGAISIPRNRASNGQRTRAMRFLAVCTVFLLSLTACAPDAKESGASADVGIQLFQWNWNSIAEHCTTTLGPSGVQWVLTSPPQEHIQGQEWWTSYQPVSYKLESRLGTEQEFKEMVRACDDAGVDIIADAVINHMTGQEQPGTGTGGSSYEHYEYPGIYTTSDFHQCGSANNDITVYTDAFEVQNCELVNLADLKTESQKVQQTIVSYLNGLTKMGVAGFRIDAAKHMPAADVHAIVEQLDGDPRIISEVIRGGGEPIQPEDYLDSGGVFEFAWGKDMKSLQVGSTFSAYFKAGTKSNYAPSEKAYTFIENHDTERNGSTLTYADPQYEVFTALMLAHSYGTPVLYSGYAFSDRDRGATLDPLEGKIFDVRCAERSNFDQSYTDGQFTCQQQWPTFRNMIAWRGTAANAPIVEQWSDGDGLAFARQGKTFIAVNRSDEPISGTWKTTLPKGEYCDGGAGQVWGEECETPTVSVDADGVVTAQINPYGVLAISIDQKA